ITVATRPVAGGSHDSFHPGSEGALGVDAKYAGFSEPSARKGTVLVGAHVHPNWSCVPPAHVTKGLVQGHHVVGTLNTVDSRACLATPRLPKSPEAEMNVSPFAIPL